MSASPELIHQATTDDGCGIATSEPAQPDVVISRYNGTVVVTVHGELDLVRAAHLGPVLADLIDGQGNLSLVVDLHDATTNDADTLWVFTDAVERARRRGGMVKLSDPPGPMYSALQLRGLDDFLAVPSAGGNEGEADA